MKKKLISRSALELLKEYPDRYFPQRSDVLNDLKNLVVEDCLNLGVRVNVYSVHGWFFIAADEDWIGSDWEYKFETFVSFPEGGVNSIRHEVFLAAYCSNVVFKNERGVHVICGEEELPSLDILEKIWIGIK